jgi:geranylgeranyl diphosphate synthase, type I
VNGIDGQTRAGPPFSPLCTSLNGHMHSSLHLWRGDLAGIVLATVTNFVTDRCAEEFVGAGSDIASDVLVGFFDGGKCVRSTFAYLGWLCGAEPDDAALRAVASFELLHAFALLQDDVMDNSALRRGRPSAHVRFAQWHRERGLAGSPERFGESAAILLGDLCLVWAEQMLRVSGLEPVALARAWPRYDAMRTELAVGQLADLVNDAGRFPTLEEVLDVSRRKSGNYTVRRPLEIGAVLAGCDHRVLAALSGYGEAVGEAFQLRDDLLGIFGTPAVTGKPAGGDLSERKATCVVVAAHHLAEAPVRHQLAELMRQRELDEADLSRWRRLIIATGAVQLIEQMIAERLARALDWLDTAGLGAPVASALVHMADACTERAA